MSWLIIFATFFISVLCAPTDNDQLDLAEFKIVGGDETTIEQYPYQVSLQYYGQHFCGGSIVNVRSILTAAHCTQTDFVRNSIDVRAGSTSLTSGGQLIRVAIVSDHPKYNSDNYDYDISILILSKPFSLNRSVQPIGIDTSYTIPEGQIAVVSGWGHTREDGELSIRLRKVNVPVVSDANCRRSYGDRISASMMCAGETHGTKDSCQADSGGPLVLDNKLIGVVSWGIGCGRDGYPGVYTRLYVLEDEWIQREIREIIFKK